MSDESIFSCFRCGKKLRNGVEFWECGKCAKNDTMEQEAEFEEPRVEDPREEQETSTTIVYGEGEHEGVGEIPKGYEFHSDVGMKRKKPWYMP